MKTIQALAFLMIPLILVTSCALAESPGYPTIAEINELLEDVYKRQDSARRDEQTWHPSKSLRR